MSRTVHNHRERAPSHRLDPDTLRASFFPGEAARLLGLNGVDYSQLRKLFRLARELRGESCPPSAWSRFTLGDLAAIEVLLSLGGGREALLRERRLILGRVESACRALRDMGFENPLLQVPLARDGRRILAKVDQYVFEPASGQLVLEETGRRVDDFLQERIINDRKIRAAIRRERTRIRPTKSRRVSILSGRVNLIETSALG